MEEKSGGELMKFDYIYGKQADQYSFVRIPKKIIKEKYLIIIF